MIARIDLEKTARAHLRDARILRRSRSYDGAVYHCGYAVEIALKARVCRALKWVDFPPDSGDFKSVFTHNLDTLLWFSGMSAKIKSGYITEWSVIKYWKPELRYSPVGTHTVKDADNIIAALTTILKVLL